VGVGQRPALLLAALSGLLETAGLEVTCAATSPDALARGLRGHRPDLALVDVGLGNGESPLAFVTALRAASPATQVVVLVPELTPAVAHAALDREVSGVVLGSSAVEDLATSLLQVHAGHSVFPAGWLAAVHHAQDHALRGRLSERQLEVLELLAAGLDNALIAQRLHISRNTVKFHVRVIYQRLGVTNRVQAARVLGDELAGAPPLLHV
jgi:DNA-binding NarL/FixJ family response regulator